MILYKNIEELKNRINKNVKGLRILEAINESQKRDENVYYSIGDSLVFMKSKKDFKSLEFKGQEMYLDIIYVESGNMVIKYSDKDKLKIIKSYDRIEDTTYYEGDGKIINITKGNILVIQKNDAYLIEQDNATKVFIKFTNENEIF